MLPGFKLSNIFRTRKKYKIRLVNTLLLYLCVAEFITLIFDIGFNRDPANRSLFVWLYEGGLVVILLLNLFKALLTIQSTVNARLRYTECFIIGLVGGIFFFRLFATDAEGHPLQWLLDISTLHFAIAIVALIELSRSSLRLEKLQLNPALLFVLSFGFLILIGTTLLLLPKATTGGISLIDAFFTITSAVCVTGLTVVDTSTAFTLFGQTVILVFIQLGGLGIMTFTSFFGYLIASGSSFQNQLILKNLVNEEQLGAVFKTILKIVYITLGVELVGAVLIFSTLDELRFASLNDRIFFAIFHAVSAFCNAGFSTFSAGLFDEALRFNYNFQLIICGLVIFGGLGFPIVFNYYRLIRRFLMHKTREIIYKEPFPHAPRVINLNTKIVVFTTLILLIAGAVGFYFLEKDNTLQEHNTYGQIVTAFFGSVTPRTAGFNTIDMMALTFPAIMLTFFLMWVGASPASTGGGIKTTTLAVATLNIFSIVRGKQRVELSKREISNESVKQAFAVISLSLIIVGFAVFALSFTDSEKGLMRLAFEAFSAFGTVGLTLGVTPELSFVGKLIIIVTMFVGRVGLFTLLKGILPDRGYQSYKYPTESVIIT